MSEQPVHLERIEYSLHALGMSSQWSGKLYLVANDKTRQISR